MCFALAAPQLTNADAHERHETRRRWAKGAKRHCAVLFALIDQDRDEKLNRDEVASMLTIMARRRDAVRAGERIVNDPLTVIMVDMARAKIDYEPALRALVRSMHHDATVDREQVTVVLLASSFVFLVVFSDRHGIMVSWYPGIMVSWYPWYHGIMEWRVERRLSTSVSLPSRVRDGDDDDESQGRRVA